MREQLLRADTFLLEIDGISAAGFARCTGLGAEAEVLEYREGGFGGSRLFRDRIRQGRIVLERGLVSDRALWDWFDSGDPRDGAVVLLDRSGKEKMRWGFEAAWPCLWEGPELDAEAPAVALERLQIVHEGLRWQVI